MGDTNFGHTLEATMEGGVNMVTATDTEGISGNNLVCISIDS
jgi:hypothetical protein